MRSDFNLADHPDGSVSDGKEVQFGMRYALRGRGRDLSFIAYARRLLNFVPMLPERLKPN